MNFRKHISIGLFVVLVLMLSACRAGDSREWLLSPDWSRGVMVGHTQSGDPAPVAVDNNGRLYTFLATLDENEESFPTLLALDRNIEPVWSETLDQPLTLFDKPTLQWDGEAVNMLWLSGKQLYLAKFSPNGEVLLSPTMLSGDAEVDDFVTAVSPENELTIWFSGARRTPILYALPTGDPTGKPVLIDPTGIRPSIQYDADGTLHAAWAHYPSGFGSSSYYYAAFDDPNAATHESERTRIFERSFGVSDILDGPKIAIDDELAYLFWTISVRTGPSAGAVSTEWMTFPLGQPELRSEIGDLFAPISSELEYEYEPEGGLLAGVRVSETAVSNQRQTHVVQNLSLLPDQHDEVAIIFETRIQYQYRQLQDQAAIRFFKDGDVNGYQLLTFTSKPSQHPVLAADADQYLYTTWLQNEGESGFDLYIASSAPDIQKNLLKLTSGDISKLSREMAFGLLSGVVLAPIIVLVWMILPLFALFITSPLRKEERGLWTALGLIISIGLAIAAFWVGKLAMLPEIREYVPFSVWISAIPMWLNPILIVGVPLLIALFGLLIAWNFTFRRQNPSVMNFMLIYMAFDGTLTLAVYGFLIYSVF